MGAIHPKAMPVILTERTAIWLAAEQSIKRNGLAVACIIGRALYRGEDLAWYEFTARLRYDYLRSLDASTRCGLGVT